MQRGKRQGSLTYREIMDALQDVELSPEQIDEIYDRLARQGVDIIADGVDVEREDDDDDVIDEKIDVNGSADEDIDLDLPAGVGLHDPVRMSRKDAGRVPLLTGGAEGELARRIDQGDEGARRKLAEANLRLV